MVDDSSKNSAPAALVDRVKDDEDREKQEDAEHEEDDADDGQW